jgi:hypothetical protein
MKEITIKIAENREEMNKLYIKKGYTIDESNTVSKDNITIYDDGQIWIDERLVWLDINSYYEESLLLNLLNKGE